MEVRITRFRLAITLLLIALGIAARLLPHEPNFVPIGAIALFGGAVLGWRTALWLPLVIMVSTDWVIGFHSTMWFVWAGFALISLFGAYLQRTSLLTRIGLGALGSGSIFFVVSNFGVWLVGGLYPPTLQGLIECFYMALPFFRTSLLADVVYSTVLFGTYALAIHTALVFKNRHRASLDARHRNDG